MKLTFITKILNFLSVTFRTIKNALKDGQKITNDIKAVADSPVVKAIVEATANPYDDAALKALQVALVAFATIMGWADKLIKDFEGDRDAKVVVYTALAAKAAVIKAEQQGYKLSMEQAMASQPVLYNPEIVNV